jgi:putative transcriptional regulator
MSLAPALLLSMPQLIDPNFAKSVVLLCEHAPEGAFGLVVNRPSDIAAAEAVRLEPPVDDPNDLPLLIGGPVEPERGWILTAQAPEHVEHRSVGAGLYLSASPVLLRRALMARPLPKRTVVLAEVAEADEPVFGDVVLVPGLGELADVIDGAGGVRVFAGYAGWGPGQLDSELAESAWLIMPVELDLIFEIPSTSAWEMAIRRLGADPHFLQMGHGIH